MDTVLSWIAGIDAVSHDVYFGTTDDPLTFIQNQPLTATTYEPATMDYETKYYWAIDERDSGGTVTAGDVWSFTTEASLPWSDGFESGSFAAGGWTTSGNASASSKAENSGIYGAEIKGTSWIEKAVSTVGFSNINIKYDRKTKGLDDGEYLYVEWYDGSYWHELEATQDTAWSFQNLTCGVGANDNAAFKVRFRTNASNSAEYAYVDDVEISSTSSEPVQDHDVAVMAITAPVSVIAGGIATIDVTVENQGTFDEALIIVTLTDTPPGGTPSEVTDSPQMITNLGHSNSNTVSFFWDTAGATSGVHSLVATAAPVTGETDTADNYMSTTSTVAEAGATIHVVVMEGTRTHKGGSGQWTAFVTVTVFDDSYPSIPVDGATVNGEWTGDASGTSSGVTGSDGKVTLSSGNIKKGTIGTATFTVTGIEHDTLIYTPDPKDQFTVPKEP